MNDNNDDNNVDDDGDDDDDDDDEALPGLVPCHPFLILKYLVSVFINACHLLSALPSLSQFGQGRLSLVLISF